METERERAHPRSHLFTLRLWEEDLGEGKTEWRGRAQSITTGETAFFRDWPGLIATLTRMVSHPHEVREEPVVDGLPQINEDS